MRNTKTYLIIFITILFFQNVKSQINSSNNDSIILKKTIEFEIEKIIIGDINNDKIIDTAYVKGPKFLNDEDWGDCKNNGCEITVRFSCDFPSITFGNAVTGFVENIGDIDNDGISEIIIVPGWIIGCWGQLHFYTIKNGKWKSVGKAKRNICREESYMTSIRKLKGNKIKVIEELWIDGDVVEKPKIILIK